MLQHILYVTHKDEIKTHGTFQHFQDWSDHGGMECLNLILAHLLFNIICSHVNPDEFYWNSKSSEIR